MSAETGLTVSPADVKRGYSLATLGTGGIPVLVKKTPGGWVKSFKAKVILDKPRGQIYQVQGKWAITAAGYDELNKYANLSIVTPPNLTVATEMGTRTFPNPYPIIDQQSGSISKVWVRKFCVGMSPTGQIVVTTAILLYDIQMYFLQDLMGKVKAKEIPGRLTNRDLLTQEEKETGLFVAIQGDFGLWVPHRDAKVMDATGNFVHNKLFAERKAQTVCGRLVMRKHPAMPAATVQARGPKDQEAAEVEVVGWTHELTPKEVEQLARMADEFGQDASGMKVEDVSPEGGQPDPEDLEGAVTGDEEDQERTWEPVGTQQATLLGGEGVV